MVSARWVCFTRDHLYVPSSWGGSAVPHCRCAGIAPGPASGGGSQLHPHRPCPLAPGAGQPSSSYSPKLQNTRFSVTLYSYMPIPRQTSAWRSIRWKKPLTTRADKASMDPASTSTSSTCCRSSWMGRLGSLFRDCSTNRRMGAAIMRLINSASRTERQADHSQNQRRPLCQGWRCPEAPARFECQ